MPWFPVRAQSVTTATAPLVVAPTGGVAKSPDPGDLTPAEQATVAQLEAALGLGSDYQVQPGLLAPGGKGQLNLQWLSNSGPQVWANLDADTGDLLNLNLNLPYPGNQAPPSGPRRSWQSDESAAAHYAKLLGGDRWAECAAVPVKPAALGFDSGTNSYRFPRQANGLEVSNGWSREGLLIDLDAQTGSFRDFRAIWTSGLNFPSPQPQLTKDQALADWEQSAPPELAMANGQTFYELPPPVLADTGKPLSSGQGPFYATGPVSLDLTAGEAVPSPKPPVEASEATAYLDQLGVLPAGKQMEQSTTEFYGTAGSPMLPVFQAMGSMWTVGSQVYSVTYTADFDTDGRLTQFNTGLQVTGPGFSGQFGGPSAESAGGTSLSQAELLKRGTAFLNAWGVSDPTAWTWQLASPPPEVKVTFSLFGLFHQNGVIDLDGTIQLGLDPATGQVSDFTYRSASAISPGGHYLDLAAVQKRLLTDFPWELRYQVSGGQAQLVYGLGDSRGAVGLRATDGAPVDGSGHDLSALFGSAPSDVPVWAAAGAAYALSNFDLATEPDGKFHPEKPVTASEVLTALIPMKQMGRLQPNFAPSVRMPGEPSILEQAKSDGLLTSLPKPGDQVNRGDLAVWAARALGFDRLLRMSTVLPTPFSDVGGLPTEQQNAIALLYDLGYFQGYPGGRFNPAAVVTRAEWAVLLDRLSGD